MKKRPGRFTVFKTGRVLEEKSRRKKGIPEGGDGDPGDPCDSMRGWKR